MMGKIGEGSFGIVYKARCKLNNKTVAMKKVRIEDRDYGVPPSTIREVTLLKELDHKNIVRLVDVVMGGSAKAIYLVFEYMATDLNRRLHSLPKNKKLDGAVVKKYVGQILDAILYCHRRRVLHRDLKPANLLIDRNDTIKVADFGLGRAFTLPVHPYTNVVVTLWYRAPEILMGTSRYSTPVDIWSIGCIFFELATGKPPFRGNSEIEQLFHIFRILGTPTDETWPDVAQLPYFKPTFPVWKPRNLSELLPEAVSEAIDLLKKMFIYVPGKRISARDALAHPYFTGSSDSKQADATDKVA